MFKRAHVGLQEAPLSQENHPGLDQDSGPPGWRQQRIPGKTVSVVHLTPDNDRPFVTRNPRERKKSTKNKKKEKRRDVLAKLVTRRPRKKPREPQEPLPSPPWEAGLGVCRREKRSHPALQPPARSWESHAHRPGCYSSLLHRAAF